MLTIGACHANGQFSAILDAAVRGKEAVVTRRGVPKVTLGGVVEPAAGAKRAMRRWQVMRSSLDRDVPVRAPHAGNGRVFGGVRFANPFKPENGQLTDLILPSGES